MRSCSVPGWEQLVTHASSHTLLLSSKKGGRASESLSRLSQDAVVRCLGKENSQEYNEILDRENSFSHDLFIRRWSTLARQA